MVFWYKSDAAFEPGNGIMIWCYIVGFRGLAGRIRNAPSKIRVVSMGMREKIWKYGDEKSSLSHHRRERRSGTRMSDMRDESEAEISRDVRLLFSAAVYKFRWCLRGSHIRALAKQCRLHLMRMSGVRWTLECHVCDMRATQKSATIWGIAIESFRFLRCWRKCQTWTFASKTRVLLSIRSLNCSKMRHEKKVEIFGCIVVR